MKGFVVHVEGAYVLCMLNESLRMYAPSHTIFRKALVGRHEIEIYGILRDELGISVLGFPFPP